MRASAPKSRSFSRVRVARYCTTLPRSATLQPSLQKTVMRVWRPDGIGAATAPDAVFSRPCEAARMAPSMAGRVGTPERVCRFQCPVRQPRTVCHPSFGDEEGRFNTCWHWQPSLARPPPPRPHRAASRCAFPRNPHPVPRPPANTPAPTCCAWLASWPSATPPAGLHVVPSCAPAPSS